MPAARVVSTRAAPSSRPGSTSFAPDHPTPAQPSSASLPDGNASPTVKRQRYSASTRPQGKRNQPRGPRFRLGPLVPRGPAQPALESATPPVISALTRSIPWKTAIKIEGFVHLSDISLNQPRRDPDTDHSFLFHSTSDTPGNERFGTSKSACGDRVDTFGHTESIPIPTQARGISI